MPILAGILGAAFAIGAAFVAIAIPVLVVAALTLGLIRFVRWIRRIAFA